MIHSCIKVAFPPSASPVVQICQALSFLQVPLNILTPYICVVVFKSFYASTKGTLLLLSFLLMVKVSSTNKARIANSRIVVLTESISVTVWVVISLFMVVVVS